MDAETRPMGFLGTCKAWSMVTSDPATQTKPEEAKDDSEG